MAGEPGVLGDNFPMPHYPPQILNLGSTARLCDDSSATNCLNHGTIFEARILCNEYLRANFLPYSKDNILYCKHQMVKSEEEYNYF